MQDTAIPDSHAGPQVHALASERCPHLFAAVEQVVALPAWQAAVACSAVAGSDT